MADKDEMTITLLNALAAAPGGTMTLADLTGHLDARFGPTEESTQDASAPENEQFRTEVRELVSEGDGSVVGRGFATADDTGALIRITEAGRRFVGR